ncbi:hypothetical protein BC830DRAFT_21981 [Chytriomyces sp. MP71]|nr:hypothetical protein BC830DRAFT_21981 [Chytriomyces sp. MP71]
MDVDHAIVPESKRAFVSEPFIATAPTLLKEQASAVTANAPHARKDTTMEKTIPLVAPIVLKAERVAVQSTREIVMDAPAVYTTPPKVADVKRGSVADVIRNFETASTMSSPSEKGQKKMDVGVPTSYVATAAATISAAAAATAAVLSSKPVSPMAEKVVTPVSTKPVESQLRVAPLVVAQQPVFSREIMNKPLAQSPVSLPAALSNPPAQLSAAHRVVEVVPSADTVIVDDDAPLAQILGPRSPVSPIKAAFEPAQTSIPNLSRGSVMSTSSTLIIPERVDSNVDDGFVYVDGKFVHVSPSGRLVEIPDSKPLPKPPSDIYTTTDAVSIPMFGERVTISRPLTTPVPKTSFAEYMQTNRFKTISADKDIVTVTETEPRGIMANVRGPVKKHVSIREPIASEVSSVPVLADRSKTTGWKFSSWFKSDDSGVRPERTMSRQSTLMPSMESRSQSIFSLFRPKSPPPPSKDELTLEDNYLDRSNTRLSVPAPDSAPLGGNPRAISVLGFSRPASSNDIIADAQADLSRMRSTSYSPQLQMRSDTPVINRDYSLRQESSSTRMQVGRPETPSTRSYHYDMRPETPLPLTLDMTRSNTVMSLSASDYHVQFASSPRSDSAQSHRFVRKMRTHSGTADHRAISRRDPESLLADLEIMFEQRGFTVASNGEGIGEYRLKIVKPGYVVGGAPVTRSNAPGIPVSIEEVSKYVVIPSEMLNAPEPTVIPLPSDVSRSISRNEKTKESGKMGRVLSGLPSSLLKKMSYVKEYGLRYNSGYDSKMGPSSAPRPDSPSQRTVRFIDEVVFYVELLKLPNLPGVCIIDFKRIRGNIWIFKKLYNGLVDELPVV